MFEVLLIVIGVLVLLGLLLVGRSRRGGSDPSTSVDAFHRALTAMEPGSEGDTRPAAGASEASDDVPADDAPAEEDDAGRQTPGDRAKDQPDGYAR